MTRSTKAAIRLDINFGMASLPGSPLTESNRRPSPYHGILLFISLSATGLIFRIMAGRRHTIEVMQYR